MLVRFLKAWRMYQPGETAAFDADLAAVLIAQRFADAAEPPDAEEPQLKAKVKA